MIGVLGSTAGRQQRIARTRRHHGAARSTPNGRIARARIRGSARTVQTHGQGCYLGRRPPEDWRLIGAGPHHNAPWPVEACASSTSKSTRSKVEPLRDLHHASGRGTVSPAPLTPSSTPGSCTAKYAAPHRIPSSPPHVHVRKGRSMPSLCSSTMCSAARRGASPPLTITPASILRRAADSVRFALPRKSMRLSATASLACWRE